MASTLTQSLVATSGSGRPTPRYITEDTIRLMEKNVLLKQQLRNVRDRMTQIRGLFSGLITEKQWAQTIQNFARPRPEDDKRLDQSDYTMRAMEQKFLLEDELAFLRPQLAELEDLTLQASRGMRSSRLVKAEPLSDDVDVTDKSAVKLEDVEMEEVKIKLEDVDMEEVEIKQECDSD